MTGFSALPISAGHEPDDLQWVGVSKILGPGWAQLPVLTVGLLGVQIMWSIEMSYASPYLISLGLSKSLIAIAFLAGPLSGLIVQPLIGVIADNSKSRFGRRRPYMIGSTIICCLSMLLLGFTRHFTLIFTRSDTFTIIVAVVALFGLDFSVNAVQAVDRALIVDTLPFALQPSGNAWAARMLGIGSVMGFYIGNVDLTKILSAFGNTEIQVLAVLAASVLLGTQLWTSVCVKERVLVSSSRQRKSLSSEVREIWDNMLTLPRVIRQICIIQFMAWLAWFPFLFYVTVYVGDLYKLSSPPPADDAASEELDKQATIVGTHASFLLGVVSLAANVVMPLFTYEEKSKGEEETNFITMRFPWLKKLQCFHICELWAFGHLLFAICMTATFFTTSVRGASILVALSGYSWAMTQWAPFSLLGEEILASANDDSYDDSASIRLLDTRSARVSTESRIARRDVLWDEAEGDVEVGETQRLMGNGDTRVSAELENGRYGVNRKDSGEGTSGASHKPQASLEEQSALAAGPPIYSGDGEGTDADDTMQITGRVQVEPVSGGLVAKAGIILGIHNLFIVLPQFLSSGITAVVFAIFDPSKSVRPGHNPGIGLPGNGNGTVSTVSSNDNASASSQLHRRAGDYDDGRGANSVAIIFRLGAIATFVAFILCWRLARELKGRRT